MGSFFCAEISGARLVFYNYQVAQIMKIGYSLITYLQL